MLVVNSTRLPPPLLCQFLAEKISSLWSVCCSLTGVHCAGLVLQIRMPSKVLPRMPGKESKGPKGTAVNPAGNYGALDRRRLAPGHPCSVDQCIFQAGVAPARNTWSCILFCASAATSRAAVPVALTSSEMCTRLRQSWPRTIGVHTATDFSYLF
jgi:hypothetical protein